MPAAFLRVAERFAPVAEPDFFALVRVVVLRLPVLLREGAFFAVAFLTGVLRAVVFAAPDFLAGALRAEGLSCDLDYGGRGTKGQFKQADRSGAAYAVVIGEDELARGTCNVRDMSSGEERAVPVAEGAKELLRAVTG